MQKEKKKKYKNFIKFIYVQNTQKLSGSLMIVI